MTTLASSQLEARRQKYAAHKNELPENEHVIVLTYLFYGLNEALNDGDNSRAKYLTQFIDKNLDLLDSLKQKLEHTKPNAKPEINETKREQQLPTIQRTVLNRYKPKSKRIKSGVEPRFHDEEFLADQKTLFECFEAYRYLYTNNLRFIAHRSSGIFIEKIEQLRLAVKSRDVELSKDAVAGARQLQQPTSLVKIPQVKDGATFAKHIDIVGIAHQFTEFEILVGGQKPKWKRPTFTARADGSFNLKKVPIIKGRNKIEIRPVGIPRLLQDEKLFLRLIIERKILPFLKGRIDPLTKVVLEEAKIEDIVRCKECQTYWLRLSWQNYDNRCLLCGAGGYWEYEHSNFELLEQ
jgi:hypothetical protein